MRTPRTLSGAWHNTNLFKIDDEGILWCALMCSRPWFTADDSTVTITGAAFFSAVSEHLAEYHPIVWEALASELPCVFTKDTHHPEEQAEGNQVDATRDGEHRDQEADSGSDQQNQHDSRHVDPLSLRGRF